MRLRPEAISTDESFVLTCDDDEDDDDNERILRFSSVKRYSAALGCKI